MIDYCSVCVLWDLSILNKSKHPILERGGKGKSCINNVIHKLFFGTYPSVLNTKVSSFKGGWNGGIPL